MYTYRAVLCEKEISKASFFFLEGDFMPEEQRASGLYRTVHFVLCGSDNKRMCVCEKEGRTEKRRGKI